MPTRFQIALPDIKVFFEENQSRLYSKMEIAEILSAQRNNWRLTQNTTAKSFIQELIKATKLQSTEISCRERSLVRYSWGAASPLQIALSIRHGSYLSHGTAVFLHELTDQIPKTIYVNKEQSPKPAPSASVTQEGINRAFSNRQRISNYSCTFGDNRCVLLSGKQTGNLEVATLTGPSGEQIQATKLERTLIDIVVRPVYAGGVFEVLEAFRSARDRFSLNTLIVTLKRLDYRYPYHQAIGFYLQRAGLESSRLERLKLLGLNFDFHLDYGVENPVFDKEWRLYLPKGL